MHETPIEGGVIVGFFSAPTGEPKPVEAAAPTEAAEIPVKETKAPTKKAPAKKTKK